MSTKIMTKIVKDPVGELNAIMDELDNQILAYRELQLIRSRIETTGMTDKLYEFLDVNKDLTALFSGLPKHDETAALESVTVQAELQCVDVALESIMTNIKAVLKSMWAAFWSFVLDWTDTNRRMHFRLNRHNVALKNSPGTYGDNSTLTKVKGVVYHYSNEWVPMKDAVKKMATALAKVNSTNINTFVKDNIKDLAEAYGVFGVSISENGIEKGLPNYAKRTRSIGPGDAGWTIAYMLSATSEAMASLKDEEASRTQFNELKRAYDKAISSEATTEDAAKLRQITQLCKLSKIYASTVARAVNDVCNLAKMHPNG